MVDKDYLDKKFQLETEKNAKKQSKTRSNRMISIKCNKHKNDNASWECPICGDFYCSDCLKVISRQEDTQVKGICKGCYYKYIFKTVIFFGTMIVLMILLVSSFFF